LIVTTVYSDNVQDEFRQDFEIRGSSVLKYGAMVRIIAVLIIIVAGVIIFALFKFARSKKKIKK
jgi:hypothetical protein